MKEDQIMLDDYVKLARREAFTAAEAAIQNRAAELERVDAEKARLAKLAAEHDLPPDASPRAISDAAMKREAEHRAAVRGKHGSWADPDQYPVGSVSNP
jgi:phage gp16-like protein